MNWSPRLVASLSVRLRRLFRSRETVISPPVPSTFGKARDRILERLLERGHVHAGALQQRGGAAVLLVEEREHAGAAAR